MRPTALLLAALLGPSAAAAQSCATATVGELTVEGAWSRATLGAGRPGALYVEVRNDGAEDDALVGVATPLASTAMLHETVVTDGVARMPHVMEVAVPAGATVALEPGGLHAMLEGLGEALEAGSTFPVTLTFARAGEVTIEADVLPLASRGPEC